MIAWAADGRRATPRSRPRSRVLPRPDVRRVGGAAAAASACTSSPRRASRPGWPQRRGRRGSWSPWARPGLGKAHMPVNDALPPSRSIPTRSPCASTARCGRSRRPPNCPWPSATSCSDGDRAAEHLLTGRLAAADRRARALRRGGGSGRPAGWSSTSPRWRPICAARNRAIGLVTAVAAACCRTPRRASASEAAEAETDARTPAPAARQASRAQGRGLLRLARRVWPRRVGGPGPHAPSRAWRPAGSDWWPGWTPSRPRCRRLHHHDRHGHRRPAAAGPGPR